MNKTNLLFLLNNTYGGDKITFHYRYRKQIIIASVLLLIIGITIYFFLTIKPTKTSKKETEQIKCPKVLLSAKIG